MAQRVGRDILADLRHLLIVLDDFPEALAAHALTVHIDEQRLLLRLGNQLGTNLLHIVAQRLDRGGIERNDALLALALAADEAGAETHVADVERDQLADSDTGGIEQLQHRVVAVALGVDALGLVKKQLDLLAGEDLRELALHLHRGNALGRVGGNQAVHLQIPVKRLDRGQ